MQESVECLLLKPNWLSDENSSASYLVQITDSNIFDIIQVIDNR